MNQKFYLENGTEVKIGDTIGRNTNGKIDISKAITITPLTLPLLIVTGIVTMKAPEKEKSELTISDYIEKFADRMGWKPEKAAGYLNHLEKVCPAAAFTVMLREIAIDLDRKYSDHINKSEKIYTISFTKGRIIEVDKAHIQNYRNFAAFRTIEDAKIACRILRGPLKDMFKSQGGK